MHESKHIEILVDVDGEVESFPVDPTKPLRETVLVRDLPEGYEGRSGRVHGLWWGL